MVCCPPSGVPETPNSLSVNIIFLTASGICAFGTEKFKVEIVTGSASTESSIPLLQVFVEIIGRAILPWNQPLTFEPSFKVRPKR